jgi:hypothetical protein
MDYLKKAEKETLLLTLIAYNYLLSKGGERTLMNFEKMGGLDQLEQLQLLS